MKHLIHTIAIASVITWTSCSEPEPLAKKNTHNFCLSDDGCNGTLVCTQNVCTTHKTQTQQLRFTFIPKNSSTYQTQRTGIIDVPIGQRLDFVLAPSLVISGAVTQHKVNAKLIEGTLVFEVPGQDSSTSRYQTRLDEGAFSLRLLPGTYDVKFISETQGLPNRIWKNKAFAANSDVRLSLPKDLLEIRSNLSIKDLITSTSRNLSGARVFAASTHTGELSTSVITQAETGFFDKLYIWKNTGSYDLIIAPSATQGLIPRVVLREAINSDTGTSLIGDAATIAELPINPKNVTFTLPEALLEESALNLNDVDITLRATVAPSQSLETSTEARIDMRGRLGEPLTLLPINYQAQVRPRPGSMFGQATFSITSEQISNKIVELESLPKNVLMRGQVLNSTGSVVPGATLSFSSTVLQEHAQHVFIDDETPSTPSTPYILHTNEHGIFKAWLDPRMQTKVLVDPGSGTGLPRAWFTLTPDNLPDTTKSPYPMRLSEPALIYGTVFGEDKQLKAQANLTVQIHSKHQDRWILLAEGITDFEGTFKVIIPAQQNN